MFYEDEYLKVDTVNIEVVYENKINKKWSKTDIDYLTEKSCIRISNKLKEINFPRKVIIFADGVRNVDTNQLKHQLGNDQKYVILNGNTNFAKENHIPLTPWVTLHRCVHAIQTTLEFFKNEWYSEIEELRYSPFIKTIETYQILGLLLTSKSRKVIRNRVDFEAEIITQYLYTGKYELNFMATDYQEILKEKLYDLSKYFQNNTMYTKGYNEKDNLRQSYEFLINPINEHIIRKSIDSRITKAMEIINSDIELAF